MILKQALEDKRAEDDRAMKAFSSGGEAPLEA